MVSAERTTPWQLAGKADGTSGSSTGPASSASVPEPDDVLKRLLQKREQDGVPVAITPPVVETAKPEEPKPTAAAPGESDEVLKKLLQKREQEQNK